MFTAKKQMTLKSAESYFADHLVYGDYYTGGLINRTGHWIGNGCKELGLPTAGIGANDGGIVEASDFSRLCRGLRPKLEDGQEKKLTLRLNANGKRVIFDDFTCSAPKSISIMACLIEDNRLILAHQKAADMAFEELEKFAATRVRKNQADYTRTTGKLVAARFTHSVSRAKDPQLHTHYICMNATFDAIEERWKALHAKQMYEATTYATAVYRNQLRRAVEELGYKTRDAKHGFEIDGVEESILQRFSLRSQAIVREVKKGEERLKRPLDNAEIANIARWIRPKKQHVSPEELTAFQLGRLTSDEMERLCSVKNAALAAGAADEAQSGVRENAPSKPSALSPGIYEKKAINYAVRHVFSRQSVAEEREIFQTALNRHPGKIDLQRLKGALKGMNFVKVGTRLTTRAVIAQEKTLLRMVNSGINQLEPLKGHYKPSAELSEDEALVMQHLLKSTDRVTGFRGLAGVGKTRVLGRLREALKPHTPLFLAPTAKAVNALKENGIEGAGTLAGFAEFLKNSQFQSKLDGGVIVLDEAGLVGVKDMLMLVKLAREKNARIILSGDTGQHTSVARGDALRLIEEYSDYRYVSMTRIRRQRDEHYKAAVLHAAEKHPLIAWEYLDRKGWITEAQNSNDQAAAHYLNCLDRKRKALVVAPTWREISRVTEKVREQLREREVLRGADHEIKVFDAQKWSEAEIGNASIYREQMRIFFRVQHGPFKQNEEVEVVRVHEDRLEVKNSDGECHTLIPSLVEKKVDVGWETTLSLAKGDRVLFRRNWNATKKHGFTNGEFGTIKAITPCGIILKDGRTLPKDYRSFTYGYCTTSHAAQGATVDEVVISASTASSQAVDSNLFYVSISRARDRCHIYTDDKGQLKEAICKSGKRMAGIELEMELEAEASKQMRSSRRKSVAPEEFLATPQEYFSAHPMSLSMRALAQAVRGRPLPMGPRRDGHLQENDLSIDL